MKDDFEDDKCHSRPLFDYNLIGSSEFRNTK